MATEKQTAINAEDEIARMKKEIEQLKALVTGGGVKVLKDVEETVKRADRIKGGGWLIKTPRETYSGITEGVLFADGMAILDEDMEGADMKAERLEHDHGYQVAAISGDEVGKQRKLMAMRQNGGGRGKTMLEKMTLPGGV